MDEGEIETTAERLSDVVQKMNSSGRTRLVIAWDDQSSVQKLREIMKEVAAQHEISVAIHVKPNGRGKAVNRRIDTEAVLVKRTEGMIYANTLRSVREEVLARGLSDTIRDVREAKNGHEPCPHRCQNTDKYK